MVKNIKKQLKTVKSVQVMEHHAIENVNRILSETMRKESFL